MDNVNPGTLIIPNGLPGIDSIKFNMESILAVESRIMEISIINPAKAPELMAAFNKAYSDLVDVIYQVQYQLEVAEIHEERARAVCLVDRVADVLKSKNLTSSKSPQGSEDLRSAVLALDPDYQAAQLKTIQLKCSLTYLEGKLRAIDKAYQGTKAVYADSSQYRHSPDLSVVPGSGSGFFKG